MHVVRHLDSILVCPEVSDASMDERPSGWEPAIMHDLLSRSQASTTGSRLHFTCVPPTDVRFAELATSALKKEKNTLRPFELTYSGQDVMWLIHATDCRVRVSRAVKRNKEK